MGILEFDAVFDELDCAKNGSITIEQLKYFIENVFHESADENFLKKCTEKICGFSDSNRISKEYFYSVLEEVSSFIFLCMIVGLQFILHLP